MLKPNEIKTKIIELYQINNRFTVWCDIKIVEMKCGEALLEVKIDENKHINLAGVAHGGLVTTLADNATGVAGATIGKRLVTSSMTIVFLKNVTAGKTLVAHAIIDNIIDKMANVSVNVYEKETKELIVKLSSSMVAVAEYEDIPRNW